MVYGVVAGFVKRVAPKSDRSDKSDKSDNARRVYLMPAV